MATQTFRLSGELSVAPILGASAGIPGITTPLSTALQLAQVQQITLVLDTDSAVPVPTGTMTAVSVLFVSASAKVRVRVTSTDGSAQSIPVDGVLLLVSESVGISAVDITRVAGQDTTVDVLMGQKVS